MKIAVRIAMVTLASAVVSGTTGCATWTKHDRPIVVDGYRMTKPLPIKAVEVRFSARALGVKRDTDTDCPLAAKFKVTYANGTANEGLIGPDQTVRHTPVQWSVPDRQGRQYLTPSSYYPDAFNRQLEAEHQADEALALAMLMDKGIDSLLASGRYGKLKGLKPEELTSFDIEIDYPQALDSLQNTWATSMIDQLVDMGAVGTRPPIILPQKERARIAAFVDMLRKDFPAANIRLPAFYTAMQSFLGESSKSDYVLHLDVEQTLNRNAALIIGNGVLSAASFCIIPISVPQKYTVISTLEDLSGNPQITANSSANMSLLVGVPLVFFALSPEHCLLNTPGLLADRECRILLKNLGDTR